MVKERVKRAVHKDFRVLFEGDYNAVRAGSFRFVLTDHCSGIALRPYTNLFLHCNKQYPTKIIKTIDQCVPCRIANCNLRVNVTVEQLLMWFPDPGLVVHAELQMLLSARGIRNLKQETAPACMWLLYMYQVHRSCTSQFCSWVLCRVHFASCLSWLTQSISASA